MIILNLQFYISKDVGSCLKVFFSHINFNFTNYEHNLIYLLFCWYPSFDLGGNNDGSGKITFLCPKCGDICTHVESLVCKYLF